MDVKLLDFTGYQLAVRAAKMCYGRPEESGDMSIEESIEFLKKIINLGHESVLEHSFFVFEVTGLSRACLQELARHRHISLSVKSTRWALKSHEDIHIPVGIPEDLENVYKRYMAQSHAFVNIVREEHGNDVAKYFLPEGFTTNLIMSLNLREFRHMWKVRHSNKALAEFRGLMEGLVNAVSEEVKSLVEYIPDRRG